MAFPIVIGFVWHLLYGRRRALNRRKWRFPARADELKTCSKAAHGALGTYPRLAEDALWAAQQVRAHDAYGIIMMNHDESCAVQT